MGVWGCNLADFPWISQDFFQHHYPVEFEGKRIVYFVALLTIAGEQGLGYAAQLFEPMSRFVADRDGWALFDCCELNRDLPAMIARLSGEFSKTGLRNIGVQTYHMVWATDSEERNQALAAV
jgi:hypothetical protein